MTELVKDYFLNRQIIVYQPKTGYRFSIDAPLLANFIKGDKNSNILEIGGGCGIISLILLKLRKFKKIYILETQKIMMQAIKKNIEENGFKERLIAINGDYTSYEFNEKFDTIFSNPPYYKTNQGKISQNKTKAISKFEIKLDSNILFSKTYKILKEKGSFYVIYPFVREKDIKKTVRKNNFFIKRERIVYPRKNRKPVFFMLELIKHSPEETEKDYITLEDNKGKYYPEIEKILRGENVYN